MPYSKLKKPHLAKHYSFMWAQKTFLIWQFNNSKFSFEYTSNNSSAMFDAFSARRYNFQSRVDLAPLRACFLRVLT